jgi:MoaA/NifB/PqqE/SkfB family radical SAM enzyme
MAHWLEISADYRCNNRCIGCFSVADDGPSMSSAEALATLRRGRTEGARSLWMGGGEPTLRKDLFGIVSAARQLGYDRVKLQTNGLMLAYPDFVRRLVEAGVTEVNVALKGHDEASHERLTRTPGAWPLVLRGIENWLATGRAIEGDVLVYRSTTPALPELVRTFRDRGIGHFNVWLFSTADTADRSLEAEVPVMTEVVAQLREARAHATLTSLHTPACTLPAELASARFFASELSLLVANPGGHAFMLEESPIEGGHYTPRCGSCSVRARCAGLRADYVRIHGEAEFQPLP